MDVVDAGTDVSDVVGLVTENVLGVPWVVVDVEDVVVGVLVVQWLVLGDVEDALAHVIHHVV
jgi:hypothetical protein